MLYRDHWQYPVTIPTKGMRGLAARSLCFILGDRSSLQRGWSYRHYWWPSLNSQVSCISSLKTPLPEWLAVPSDRVSWYRHSSTISSNLFCNVQFSGELSGSFFCERHPSLALLLQCDVLSMTCSFIYFSSDSFLASIKYLDAGIFGRGC